MHNLLIFKQMTLFPLTRMEPCGAWTMHTGIHMDVGLCTHAFTTIWDLWNPFREQNWFAPCTCE